MRRLLLGFAVALLCAVGLAAPAHAVIPVSPPSIAGAAAYGATLTASTGTWEPAPVTYAYQWLRDGRPVALATAPSYVVTLDDVGHTLAVQVIVADGLGATTSAVSASTAPVPRPQLAARGGQRIVGEARWTHTLHVREGRLGQPVSTVGYQWLRAGEEIAGATDSSYQIAPEDVGSRLTVRITAQARGFDPVDVVTDPTPRVGYRIGVRRVVTYHVETRGHVTADVAEFRRLAQQTYDDPRGWRDAGIEFRQVAHGGAFTLVLAQAGLVPSFSSQCSAMWSCRVGRFVVINQDRWLHAAPAWNAARLALRDYRHMVVDHETGHWLGLGHAPCPGPGRLAPVMMQQSKGLDGCRFNPWPTAREVASRTPHRRHRSSG